MEPFKNRNYDFVTIFLFIGAVSTLFLLIYQFAYNSSEIKLNPTYIPNWEKLINSENSFNTNKKGVIINFFSYDCSSCKYQFHELDKFKHNNYDSNFAVIYKAFPSSQSSLIKSMAAECSRKFGVYEQFHGLLFEVGDSEVLPIY